MRIGWAIMTVGCFGSVREMVEISNALIARGHSVTIYHLTGGPVVWLPSRAQTGTLEQAEAADLDILIGFPEFTVPRVFHTLEAARAKLKAVVAAGFTPSPDLAATLRGAQAPTAKDIRRLRDAVWSYWLLPDSDWQRDWFRDSVGIETGPGWAGVNLEQFRPIHIKRGNKLRIAWSGDPRTRKGADTVEAALALVRGEEPEIETDSYWGKRIPQADLAEWICRANIFVDGHRRAGWCNPVAEAMACGVATVCTDIPATRMIAQHEQTALVVPTDDPEAMAAAVVRLLRDRPLRLALRRTAMERIAAYSYPLMAERLEQALEAKLNAFSLARSEDGREQPDHAAKAPVWGGVREAPKLATNDADEMASGLGAVEAEDLPERAL